MNTPQNPQRRRHSLRLPDYDYGQAGAYFVTVCTRDRLPLFGSIAGNEMQLTKAGRAVAERGSAIPDHYPHAETDAFVVMPNHIHGIIFITETSVGANNHSPLRSGCSSFRSPSRTLGSIVRGFKIGVTKWFRANTDVRDVWQRNYYEHVIRSEATLRDIRAYIVNNPAKWTEDPEYVDPV